MTKKVIGEPGSGKTKKIMELCANEKASFVCKNPEAMRVKAHAYGFDNLTILSYGEFITSSHFERNNVYLDDIDEFLETIGCLVKGFGGNAI